MATWGGNGFLEEGPEFFMLSTSANLLTPSPVMIDSPKMVQLIMLGGVFVEGVLEIRGSGDFLG